MTDSQDQDQIMDHPQVDRGTIVGSPPSNLPPPPPGGGVMHADSITECWACDDDSSNANVNQANSEADDDASSQVSDGVASEVSEDAISVLAQVAVEDAIEVAVKQASDDNQDSINANATVSFSGQPLTTMEAEGLPRCYRNDSDMDDSEEDGEGWRVEQNYRPSSLLRPTCSTNKMQPPDDSNDDNDETSEYQPEVMAEAKTFTPVNLFPSQTNAVCLSV